ncbi:MAG: hypothetical protein ABI693_03325 [Bryobacteraceae bacterium]
MLLAPQTAEGPGHPGLKRGETMDAGVASCTQSDQPGGAVGTGPAVMHDEAVRGATDTAGLVVTEKYLCAMTAEASSGMSGTAVARAAEAGSDGAGTAGAQHESIISDKRHSRK